MEEGFRDRDFLTNEPTRAMDGQSQQRGQRARHPRQLTVSVYFDRPPAAAGGARQIAVVALRQSLLLSGLKQPRLEIGAAAKGEWHNLGTPESSLPSPAKGAR